MSEKSNSNGGERMKNNVIPMTKKMPRTSKFPVFLGEIDDAGQVAEKEQVGLGFMRDGSKSFRLKLWMFAQSPFVMVPDKRDNTRYAIYSVEEYFSGEKEVQSFWNKIGEAELLGNYLSLRIPLFGRELFMSLFPDDFRASSEMRTA
jgi:hypothetical protein